jgi:hypothetical protein
MMPQGFRVLISPAPERGLPHERNGERGPGHLDAEQAKLGIRAARASFIRHQADLASAKEGAVLLITGGGG